MEHKLIFKDGNVTTKSCKFWWDDNPLPTIKNGDVIEREEGERFSITVVKDGYKSKILLDTFNLERSELLVTKLEKITESKYIYVTPYIHARQLYKLFNPSSPVRWKKISDNVIEVVPSDNWIKKGVSSKRFEILFDSSSRVAMSLTKGIKQYLTNYNHFREFILDTDLEPVDNVYGTITITNQDKKQFIIKVVSKLSE